MGRGMWMRSEEIMRFERELAEYHVEQGDELLAVFQTTQLRPYTSRLLVTRRLVGAGLDYPNAYVFKPQNAYRRDQLAVVAYEPEGFMSLRATDGRGARFRLLYPEELPILRKALPPISRLPGQAHPQDLGPQEKQISAEGVRNDDPPSKEQKHRDDRWRKRAPASRTGNVNDVVEDLTALSDLLDRGIITSEEFQNLKKRALER